MMPINPTILHLNPLVVSLYRGIVSIQLISQPDIVEGSQKVGLLQLTQGTVVNGLCVVWFYKDGLVVKFYGITARH